MFGSYARFEKKDKSWDTLLSSCVKLVQQKRSCRNSLCCFGSFLLFFFTLFLHVSFWYYNIDNMRFDLWCQLCIHSLYIEPLLSVFSYCSHSSLCLFLHDGNRLISPNTHLHTAIASIWFVDGCCRAKLPLFSPLCSSCTASLLFSPLAIPSLYPLPWPFN